MSNQSAGHDRPVDRTVDLGDVALFTRTWGSGPPQLVMLHDGLGSVTQWRDVPAALAEATGLTVMAYDRAGHGSSLPTPTGPWPAGWLHREAEVLGRLLAETGADAPVLVGHSDGGSIAAIYAADSQMTSPLVLLAAHSYVEPMNVDVISDMRSDPDKLVDVLGRFHDDAAAVFEAWSGGWVGEGFAEWDVRPLIGSVQAPTLVVQGDLDEYATAQHAVETADAIGDNAQLMMLPGMGHLIHHQDPDMLVELVASFVAN